MNMDGWDVLEHAHELSQRGEAFALATVVWRRGPSSGKQGCRAIVTAEGKVHGWIGGACAEPAVIREARHALAEGVPHLMFLGTREELESGVRDGMTSVPISCQSEGALEVFIEPVEPKPHLVVVGRSPMAESLVALAHEIGWRTVLVDADGGSAEDQRGADRVVNGLDLEAAGCNERSLVVVATQGHHDEESVAQALAAGPAYVGLVGSSRRGASVLDFLRERGVADEALQRVQVPAGLDLGRISHREIAVAILAQLVQLRAAGAVGGGMPAQIPEVVEATDPVCGMTVEVATARHTADHEGQSYYFCCPGCRRSFQKDPMAFLGAEVTT